MSPVKISIIAPVYNEAVGLSHFHASLDKQLKKIGLPYEVIYIDDGSVDGSEKVIRDLAAAHPDIKPLFLSKNFGKEAATTAGLHAATGKAALIIDSDGQHPVELIADFIKKWQHGAKVIVGVRASNQKEGFVKRFGSKLFYSSLRLLGVSTMVPRSTDFRLVDQEVLASFRKLNEHTRVTRALIDWLGYDREYIHFHAKAREHGEASYSTKKLIQLALNGFVSLSFRPLYLSGYLGMFITFVSFITALFALIEKYVLSDPLSLNITGTAILAVLLLFSVGILLICQGLLAIYIARIYVEVQNRPLYLLKD